MAIVGDTLWVADVDAVRSFDRKTGTPKTQVAVSGSTFLNDLSTSADGKRIYGADSGHCGTPGGDFKLIVENLQTPADIGYGSKRQRILVPLFMKDEVHLYPIQVGPPGTEAAGKP